MIPIEELPKELQDQLKPIEYVKVPLLNNPEVIKRVIEERKRLEAEGLLIDDDSEIEIIYVKRFKNLN